MSLIINEECINCDACEPECPNNAIYPPGEMWRFSDKTSLNGNIISPSGATYEADAEQEALSEDFYYIVPDKCTECLGFHEEPQCMSVCPVDCIEKDSEHTESEDILLAKKDWLHS